MLQKSAAEENTVLTSHASKIVVSGPVQQCKACVVFCASPDVLAGCAPALDANRCTHDAGTQVTWRSIKHSACVNFSVKYPPELEHEHKHKHKLLAELERKPKPDLLSE